MAEEKRKLPKNMLTAEELLQNKGIKCVALDEFEKSSKVLPRTGKKQFEPNGSWLQNMQIEKGIATQKDLIGVERVDRISQLATAEWLDAQKKARVKKYSGQDWGNFGLEKHGFLYLIPEEALFLLEANSLELTWNNVPLSIQQAYELLIDNIECSMAEYRVYNQLVRYGYRIQRFVYESEGNVKNNERTFNMKRKVIVDPENGLWMTDNSQQSIKECINRNNENPEECRENVDMDISDSDIEIWQDVTTEDPTIKNDVHNVMEDLLCTVVNMEMQCSNVMHTNDKDSTQQPTNTTPVKANGDNKKRKSNIEIISEETLLGDIKIIRQSTNSSTKEDTTSSNWRASRIQRNVKLLPKRTSRPSTADGTVVDFNSKVREPSPEIVKEESQTRKPGHEVIELSDDEIQEVPRPLTRMELLNFIPNIACLARTTVQISRGYIPHSVKPHKNVYHYENSKLRNLHETDKRLRSRQNSECYNNNVNGNTSQCNNISRLELARRNTNVPTFSQNVSTNIQDVFVREFYPMDRAQCTNYGSSYMYNNRFQYRYNQNAYWQHRNTTFQNVFVALENHSGAVHNRFLSIQTNNFTVPQMGNNLMRGPFIRNHFRQSFQQNLQPQQKMYQHRIEENMSLHCSVSRNTSYPEPRQRFHSRDYSIGSSSSSHFHNEVNQPSFKKISGARSWSELKTKWGEEKTITIDDEDMRRDEAANCNSGQVAGQCHPLVGPRNANSLSDVFSKLKIIKSAPEKTVRKKKSRYKISYNVYSNSQHYRKANPGVPLYRVVVIRQKEDPFLQPIDIHRLQQDSSNAPVVLACVSMTISYIQAGFISVPNLT